MKNKYRSIHPDDWDSVKQIIQPRYSYSLEIADFLYDLYRTEKDHGKF